MSRPAIYMTATKVSNWAEDGSGNHSEEHGWINPNWSLTEIYENFNDVNPVELFDNDSEETYAQWVTRVVRENLNGVEWDGGDTFYAAGVEIPNYATGDEMHYALHVIGIDDDYWTDFVAPFVTV